MTNQQFKKMVWDTGLTYNELGQKIGYKGETLEAICNGRRRLLKRHIDAVKGVKK